MSQTTNSVTTRYLLGLDVLGQQQGTQWSYFGYDGLGSVRQLTDANGVVRFDTSFNPYGKAFEQGGTYTTSLGFTGEFADSNGLLFLRARYYNASIAAFTSRDPVGGTMRHVMSRNGYSYVEGNPVNKVDPSGMIPAFPCPENYTDAPPTPTIPTTVTPTPTGTGTPSITGTPNTACYMPEDFLKQGAFRDLAEQVRQCVISMQNASEVSSFMSLVNADFPAGSSMGVATTFSGTTKADLKAFGIWVKGFAGPGAKYNEITALFYTPSSTYLRAGTTLSFDYDSGDSGYPLAIMFAVDQNNQISYDLLAGFLSRLGQGLVTIDTVEDYYGKDGSACNTGNAFGTHEDPVLIGANSCLVEAFTSSLDNSAQSMGGPGDNGVGGYCIMWKDPRNTSTTECGQ